MDTSPLRGTKLSRRQLWGVVAGGVLAARAEEYVPGKRDMIVRSARPLDLEMPLSGFSDYVTPLEHFFVRTHVYSPKVELANWRLKIEGNIAEPLTLSIDDLRRMPSAEIVSVLECAGNGRSFYDPPVAGLQWAHGAVGNGRWRGVRLGDVLKRSGVKADSVEVLFDGADVPIGKMADFRRSIPLSKALHPDTLLAYELNGQPLPLEHGFPLRAVVPGWAGDSWVKWIAGIQVLAKPDSGYWMTSAYKHPGRPVAPGTVLPAAGLPPVTSLRVKSVISSPSQGSIFKVAEPVVVRGTAWSGESGPIQSVDVSVDNGRSWKAAQFIDPPTRWGWRRWEFHWTPQSEQYQTIFARARDTKGDAQPAAQEWNQSGYLWNVIAKVGVNVVRDVTSTSAPQILSDKSAGDISANCKVCHADDVIRQQRLTRAQWDREITKMTDWGAEVATQDREALLDSLTRISGGR